MLLVNSQDTLKDLLHFLEHTETVAYDIETTGLNVHKDIIIGFGISDAGFGAYVPLLAYVDEKLQRVGLSDENILQILAVLQTKKLLTWNASFDLRFTKEYFGVDLVPALHADVLLLKHTCDEEFPFGLKEVAVTLFGDYVTDEKKAMQASIKDNGGTAKEYYKADLALISKYCVQDCLLTYRIYEHYLPQLAADGLEQFFFTDEVMPLYKEVTIPMEAKGIQLNVDLVQTALAEVCADLAHLEARIQCEIVGHLEAVFVPWLLNKDYPMKTATGRAPKWMQQGLTQYQAWAADNPEGYMFNLLSKHHLKKLFFDTLKLTPLSRTPTGLPQVDEEFLQATAKSLDWVHLLIDYNKLTKLKGTYIERFLQEAEHGIIYPSFQQHRTVSGRFSGDLQQLPRPLEPGQASELVRKHTNRIREFFIPRSGNMLISADYEQLEPTVFAHISGDPALHHIFNSGLDFYSEVAIRTEGLAGVSSDKQAPTYLGKVNKAKRQSAKAYALGIAYGMTGYKLQFEIGVSQDEAESLVTKYLAAFPRLAAWMESSKRQVLVSGSIRSEAGRVRRLPAARRLHGLYGPKFTDSLWLWSKYNDNPELYADKKRERKVLINELNNAINFQVQSLAASIVNRASIQLARKGYVPLLQVHDELVYEVPAANVRGASSVIKEVMENIMHLAVPLRTVPQAGTNYRETK